MLKNKFNLLVVINTIAVLIILTFLVFKLFFNAEKIAYADNLKLFDGFTMTKEMKRIGEKEFNSRKLLVDSLYAEVQKEGMTEAEKAKLVHEFAQRRDELEQFGQSFASEEGTKIWSRINGYTQEFAKEKGYDLILTSEEKRSVLFADESIDVTSELTNYINKKYEGLK